MALPGLLIEYLVVGSMALLWALPLTDIQFVNEIPLGKAAALAPAIYVLGMFIDFVAFFSMSLFPTRKKSLKYLVRKIAVKQYMAKKLEENNCTELPVNSKKAKIWLYLNASDLVTEMKMRSSRDRVARGALINILILWFITKRFPENALLFLRDLSVFQWIVITVVSFLMWAALEMNSYLFELRSNEMVPENER